MRTLYTKRVKIVLCSLTAALLVGAWPVLPVNAAYMGSHSLRMSTAAAGARNATYTVSYTIATPGTLGSMSILFCSNSTLLQDPCIAPYGFNATNATPQTSSGITDFSMSSSSTMNDIILSRIPSSVGAISGSIEFSGFINPTNAGSYFVRIITYPTNDASGPPTDNGGIAFDVLPDVTVTSTVPPFLTFCTGMTITGFDCSSANGYFADLGPLRSDATETAHTQIVVATNGGNGYTITSSGTTLTSGNNIIPAAQGASSTIGTSQFGLNLRANTNPSGGSDPIGPGTAAATSGYNVPNLYRFNNGDIIASATQAQDYKKFTASYIVNVAKSQAPGVYATTVTFICLANF